MPVSNNNKERVTRFNKDIKIKYIHSANKPARKILSRQLSSWEPALVIRYL